MYLGSCSIRVDGGLSREDDNGYLRVGSSTVWRTGVVRVGLELRNWGSNSGSRR